MSNAIFPELIGRQFDSTKTPTWSTTVQTAVNGTETRAAWYNNPIWKFEISYDILRDASDYLELQNIMGFYNARQGSFDSFLYSDPYDNTVINQQIGVGDGNTVNFQLLRSFGNFVEPVTAPNVIQYVYIDGVPVTSFGGGLDTNGIISFYVAPGSESVITWTGSFYFRCRFEDDSQDYSNFMYQLWELKKCNFRSLLGETESSGSYEPGYSGANIIIGSTGLSGYSGINGSTGTSGYSGIGTSGYSGINGSTGTSGYSGNNGTNGASGYSGIGTSGYSGYSSTGTSGYSGINGSIGTSGYSGYSSIGTSGYSGYSSTGTSGYSGTNGTSGYSGYSSIGTSGYSGIGTSGYSGYSGATGAGTSGYSGYSSTSGYSGYSSTSGYSGYSSTSGYSGYSGPQPLSVASKTTANSGDTLVKMTLYLIDASGGACNFNLPAAPANGDHIQVNDYLGTFAVNNVTLNRNGNNILGIADNLLCDVNNVILDLYYTGATEGWTVGIIGATNAINLGQSGYSGFSGYSGINNLTLIDMGNSLSIAQYSPAVGLTIDGGNSVTIGT